MLGAALIQSACSDSDSDDFIRGSDGGAPGSGDWTLDAGALKLRAEENPWRLRFFDAEGEPLLDEHAATGTGPLGALGFHLGLPPLGDGLLPLLPPPVADVPQAPIERGFGWFHATRLLESRYEGERSRRGLFLRAREGTPYSPSALAKKARGGGVWHATLATNDPSGRTLALRAEIRGDGVIAFTVTPGSTTGIQAMGIGFGAEPQERFFGFGERSNAVNQRGRAVEHYVGEGPYQDLEYPFVTLLVPKWGIRWRKDATYFPIPWLLSSRGYGVLLDNDALAYHRLDASDGWSMETEERELRFRVFAGPRPADVLRRYTVELGAQPRDYAPWFFGPWVQPDSNERITELREADVPTSVAATYLHYLPCGDQQGREAEQPERVARLNGEGTAVHTYFNPMICTDYQPAYAQAQAAGALLKDRSGNPYVYPYTGSTVFNVSQFDFSAPAGIEFYAGLAREAIGHGYEGWMEDFGEYTPLDAVAADGATGTRLHNRYVRDYHCGIFEGLKDVGKPLARFVRSGWTGSAACSPIVWGGDPTTSMGFDGLESSIYQALSLGTSGVGIWGSDIGGFFALGPNTLSGETLDRWVQFGAFSTVMRTQANGFHLPDSPRPQIWDAAHLPIWRRYAKLHTQLWPYLQAAVEAYYASGLPVMRHHLLTHPDDESAIARDDQYLFGPSLLVAPVVREGASARSLYLPAGAWVDWWRSIEYRESDGSIHLTGTALLDGGREVALPAPREEIPLLVEAGALLALLPPDVDTLAEHGDNPAIVHATDRADRLRVLAFPRGASANAFYQNEQLISEEGQGEWRLTIQGERLRTVELEAALGSLERPFRPCAASASGGELLNWSYETGSEILTARMRLRAGTLLVRGC